MSENKEQIEEAADPTCRDLITPTGWKIQSDKEGKIAQDCEKKLGPEGEKKLRKEKYPGKEKEAPVKEWYQSQLHEALLKKFKIKK